jgi:hypothetical protein
LCSRMTRGSSFFDQVGFSHMKTVHWDDDQVGFGNFLAGHYLFAREHFGCLYKSCSFLDADILSAKVSFTLEINLYLKMIFIYLKLNCLIIDVKMNEL